MHFYPIVQLQPDFARNDVFKINRIRCVHTWMVWLQVCKGSRQFLFRLPQSRLQIRWRGGGCAVGGKREQTKPESAQGWEIRDVRTRRSVIWKRRSNVGPPEAVEFHPGK